MEPFQGTRHGSRAISWNWRLLRHWKAERTEIPGGTRQLISTEDIPRIKRPGVLICAQPSALNNPEKDRTILGEDRAKRAYPYRILLDSGVPLSFGSEAPGEKTFNPFVVIHYAVNRDGDEKISLIEALKCYTAGSAYAEFKEDAKGCLSPGMAADFTILSGNLLATEKHGIKDVTIYQTFVDGRIVYESPK